MAARAFVAPLLVAAGLACTSKDSSPANASRVNANTTGDPTTAAQQTTDGGASPTVAPTTTATTTVPPAQGTTGTTPNPSCSAGLALCPNGCKDLQNDKLNCGSCNHACALHCQGGACLDACPTGLKSCRGICVDVSTHLVHCGDCNQPCASGQICSSGTCTCGASVSYAQIQPTFDASCVTSGCHTGATPAAGLSLESGKSFAQLVNVAATTCFIDGKKRVLPGDPMASSLYNRVSGKFLCGGSQEPPNGPPLSAAQQELIRAWICNGAPSN